MIGNDLVDLDEASRQSNWMRKGYLEKVFSATEIEQIRCTKQQNQLVWLFWSMKEAAYKIDSRLTGIRAFAPTSLACIDVNINEGMATGKVVVNEKTYFTETDLKDTYIHSVAAQSAGRLSSIRKELYTYPLESFNYKLRKPACLSHHGRYLALIF
jgi:phosphopantetheinyl transferase (holo-ACP synthase)